VTLLRKPAFLAAVAVTTLLGMYMALVAQYAFAFMQGDDPVAKALGAALLMFPVIGLWWIVQEWRMGATVQRMADRLEREGHLPVVDGAVSPSGRVSEEAAATAFDIAQREVEFAPDDWVSWFHLAYAYDANKDRRMARKSLKYAAELFRDAVKDDRSR
jgi:hypothetical protein